MKLTSLPNLLKLTRQLLSEDARRRSRKNKTGNGLQFSEALEDRTLMTGDIAGQVFNDLNANGVADPGENGLAGWTVFVDTNKDGSYTTGEPITATDSKGKFSIVGLPAGAMNVYEVPQAGFIPTPGFSDHQTITVRDARTVKFDFPNVTAPIVNGQIVGTVFDDANLNGIKESGEKGLTGWTVFVDSNGDGTLNAGESFGISDTDGDYLIADVPAGTKTVVQIPQGNYAPVGAGLFPLASPLNRQQATVVAGSSIRADFANQPSPTGTIQGSVWNDANGDGIHQASETPLAGRTVFVDLNNNGSLDAAEPQRTTDANGAYSFAGIRAGAYHIVETISAGMISADNWPSDVTINVFQGSVITLDFYNLTPVTGSIGGTLWNDANGDGLRSADETPLIGWQVFIDSNGSGTLDAGEPSQMTDETGSYNFSGVAYGFATLREIVPATWIATGSTADVRTVHLLNGEDRTGIDFGNRERIGTIQGTVWNDANGDRVHGTTESGLADWTVFLDLNGDGVQDVTEPAAQTDASGQYVLSRVPAGSYRVVEVLPTGWISSEGTTSARNTTLAIGGVNVLNFDSLVPVASTLSGTVWSDMNSNGVQDAAETGLEGWQVYADLNTNGSLDAGEPVATTDVNGVYTLADVPYGTHTIREIVQAGFTPTNHPGGLVTSLILNGETRTGVDFGNHEPVDFTISGLVFHDANKNGAHDAGESGISGVTIYIDSNNNGLLDPAEPVATTSVDLFYTPAVNEIGTYTFTHLARGTYHVREVIPAPLEGTPAAVREQIVTIGPASATSVDFADQYRANEIHGVIFDDTNDNHIYDAQEYARPGVSVYIDTNRNDVHDPDELETVTGADGAYSF